MTACECTARFVTDVLQLMNVWYFRTKIANVDCCPIGPAAPGHYRARYYSVDSGGSFSREDLSAYALEKIAFRK